MAISQAQVTVPSNGLQVVVFLAQAVNSNQLTLKNTGSNTVLLGPQQYLNPPLNLTATSIASGGTFAAGTYYWKVTATNALGATTGSNEASATLVLDGSATLSWTAVAGATGYNIYRSTSSGGESTSPALVTSVSGTTYTETGTATSSGAVLATNTAAVPALFPLASGASLTTTTTFDDTLVAQVQTAGTAGQLTWLACG